MKRASPEGGGTRIGHELPALDLQSLVQRHASGFGRVRACGDWSDQRFRLATGPLLLAFARHAYLLPATLDEPPGSLLEAGLEACADAVLASAMATTAPGARQGGAPGIAGGVAGQEAAVLHALSPWVAAATARWHVRMKDGRALVLAARPLADQLADAAAMRRPPLEATSCWIEPAAAPEAGIDDRPGARLLGMVLLLRALPEPALAAVVASAPSLLDTALSLSTPGPAPRQLRDTMHALIAAGHWTVNVRRARLWHLDGRLYLAWKTAANELAARLALEPAILLPTMVRQGIVLDRPAAPTGLHADPAGPMLTIRTPYTEALPVVELGDPGAWLRSVPQAGCSA